MKAIGGWLLMAFGTWGLIMYVLLVQVFDVVPQSDPAASVLIAAQGLWLARGGEDHGEE